MRDRLRTHAIAIAGREAAAFARQALLVWRGVGEPAVPAAARDGDDVVVLLHGLFASAGVLRPLRAAISSRSPAPPAPAIHTAALSYPPGPGIEALAGRLGAVLRELPRGVRLHLCGHSVGGIVCNLYAQESGDPRVVQTISMATPFGGVPGARLLGFDCARDLAPNSPMLRRILLGAARSGIPHLSIIAGSDTMVRSPVAHALPGGEVRIMHGRGHNTLLFDPEVAALIVRRVLDLRAERAAAAPDVAGPANAELPREPANAELPGDLPLAAE
jgi:pimeloyl-ACP methyl ester carboxylesterase